MIKTIFLCEIAKRCLFLYQVHVFRISVTGMPFLFFFITFCSHCGMNWDTACRPTNDGFWAFFITWCARSSSTPKQNLFSLGSWKKKYFGRSSKKDNHPGPLPQQGFFVLLYKFETSWTLIGSLSRGFFAISGAPNFKHFKSPWL